MEDTRLRLRVAQPDDLPALHALILAQCEHAARAEGFTRAELVATMAGLPLYSACGHEVVERFTDDRGGTPVPLASW